ncbi:hypothetical protein ACFO4P_12920 [Epilithonimonas pallida]|uniref:Phage protein n=1 Tax=Epilithonimonas pallida TaxID=373671 RepID=A0ABY1R8T5_9FLAO|nr:hypothetical protein [Epilithonimonas pallida]SMP95460.1 hypothetical protein SAMN05421679_107130 [Epilithonimonas pallida]
MVTKEKARKILLDEGENFSDEEMDKIIEQLDEYATMVLEIISEKENIDDDLKNTENEKS